MTDRPVPQPRRLPMFLAVVAAAFLHGLFGVLNLGPFGQFYLGWLAIVPVLWLSATAATPLRAFGRGYLAGVFYFGGNLWYLWYIGFFPMLGSGLYLALYPAIFAIAWRPWARRSPLVAVVAAATLWVGVDWLRATVLTGLPYVFLGHGQLPLLSMVQIADVVGTYGVTFWVVLIGATMWTVLHQTGASAPASRVRDAGAEAPARGRWTRLLAPIVLTLVVLASTFGYGRHRLAHARFEPGPTVLLVQPDVPLLNTVPTDDVALLRDLLDATRGAMTSDVDLVVWPESAAPPLNVEARNLGLGGLYGQIIRLAHSELKSLSAGGVDLLVGASYRGDWTVEPDGSAHAGDRRNSVFHYADGLQVDARYDKTHLFPFGEYIPLLDAPAPLGWLGDFFNLFNPWGNDYSLTPGDDVPIFNAGGVRVVTPICFEDIIPARTREMVYGDDGTRDADLLVNLTNDGWFRGNQMDQHLQAAAFRSIENRLPTARSVNTGVSAIVDGDGRVTARLPAGEAGTLVGVVPLDDRQSLYGRVGDVFAVACAITSAALAAVAIVGRFRKRKDA